MGEIRKVPANQSVAQAIGKPRKDREKDSERDSFKRILSEEQEEVSDGGEDNHPEEEEHGEGKSLPGDDARGLLLDEKV